MIKPGQVYMLLDLTTLFVVVKHHSMDPDLWFIVPGDGLKMLGTKDVAVPSTAEFNPLFFRCSTGIWVEKHDLEPSLKAGEISGVYVSYILDTLHRIVSKTTSTRVSRVSTDSDLTYMRHMAVVSQKVQDYEHFLLNGDL